MRASIPLAALAFALSACGDKAGGDGGASVSENTAAEAIFSNDTTAIDAATGDASNMAADVAYTVNSTETDGAVRADGNSTRTRSRQSTDADRAAPQNSSDTAEPDETAVDSNGV